MIVQLAFTCKLASGSAQPVVFAIKPATAQASPRKLPSVIAVALEVATEIAIATCCFSSAHRTGCLPTGVRLGLCAPAACTREPWSPYEEGLSTYSRKNDSSTRTSREMMLSRFLIDDAWVRNRCRKLDIDTKSILYRRNIDMMSI